MPKVTEEYKEMKKDRIIQATIKILEQKPLYEISMLDIIKQANLSKGGIYLYFSDIDELLIETINRIMSSKETIVLSEEVIGENVEADLIRNFQLLGEYIDMSPSIIGKIRHELVIYMTSNPHKADRYLANLKYQDMGNQFMKLISQLIQKGIEHNLFRKEIKIEVVMTNISAYVDGMTDIVVRAKSYGGQKLDYPLKVYLEQFIRSMILELK